MGNKAAVIPFVLVACVLASAAFLVSPKPADASRGDRPAGISDTLLKRLCDRQEALKGRLGWYFVHPSFCEGEPEPEEPSVSITANPMTIPVGSSTTLAWNSDNADSCTASNGWSGTKALDGAQQVAPAVTTTYTITCEGDGGSANDSVTVTVTQSEPEDPTLDLTANPTTIDEGSSSLLSWTTTNATSCEKSGGWSGATTTSGTLSVSPTATTTFAMECTGPGGSISDSVTVNVRLVPDEPDEPTVNLVAAPTTVHENSAGNATTTLTWTTTNATSCTASGGAFTGSKAVNGSQTVTPSATTTYSLDCTGPGGNANDSVTVNFVPEPGPGPSGNLLITEVHYDLSNSTTTPQGEEPGNEWIELHNGTNQTLDLGGYTIHDSAGSDTIPAGTMLAAGQFIVITSSATTSSFYSIPGNAAILVLASSIGSNGLGNAGDMVEIRNDEANTVDAVSWGSNTTAFTPSVRPGTTADDFPGQSIGRINISVDTGAAADWETKSTPTPGQ